MMTESIPIPAERVPPIASEMASSSKTVAGVLFFVAVICVFAAMATMSDERKDRYRDEDPAHAAGGLVGSTLIAGLPLLFAFRSVRNASRATRAGKLASTDSTYTFRLAGKFIIAADGAGVPHPAQSFKINQKLRTMLLALPRAEVVDRQS
jgi:hypothetical protein